MFTLDWIGLDRKRVLRVGPCRSMRVLAVRVVLGASLNLLSFSASGSSSVPDYNGWKSTQHPHSTRIAFWIVLARAHQAASHQNSPFGSMFVFPVCNGWKSAQHPHSIRITFWAVFGAAPQAPNPASESCLFFYFCDNLLELGNVT